MGIIRKLRSKIASSMYVFRRAEILHNMVAKEMGVCILYPRRKYEELIGKKSDEELRISIYLGGALGDYIVYLRFVDEISSKCKCAVDLYLDRPEFGEFVYGKRQNIHIVYDIDNTLFTKFADLYELSIHLDHGITVKCCDLGSIRKKAPSFVQTALQIVKKYRTDKVDIGDQYYRESVILRKAKLTGQTKWSKLSCGSAIDMSEMYSSVLLNPEAFSAMEQFDLVGKKYITVNYGADKHMGGTAQTKVLPIAALENFIKKFKTEYPDYLVVQTGISSSPSLNGADRRIFHSSLEEVSVVLKYSACHVDSEGGLIHLASSLSTPCVVAFGPTPAYYYGYLRNENIVSPACSDCMAVIPRWSVECPRQLSEPICMRAITDNMILERVKKILSRPAPTVNVPIEMTRFSALSDILSGSAKYVTICLIGPLDEAAFSFARRMRRNGADVCLFIPTDLDEFIVSRRERLLKIGVRVAYGNALSIAKPSHSFDLLICRMNGIEEKLRSAVRLECRRIIKVSGRIVWYEENDETIDTSIKTAM